MNVQVTSNSNVHNASLLRLHSGMRLPRDRSGANKILARNLNMEK